MSKLNSKQLLYPLSGSFTGSLLGSASYASTSSLSISSSYVKLIAGSNIAINYTSQGIEISSSGGGGGGSTNPGGNSGQIQYNNSGFFGGVSDLTYDGITLKATGSFTGSLRGIATTASYVTGSIFSSGNLARSSSYALTASYAINAGAGVGFPFSGSAVITGSLLVSGGVNVTNGITGSFSGSVFGYVSNSQTSSFASTSSFNFWTGSNLSRFYGTSSYVQLIDGPGIQIEGMQITSLLRTINGQTPTNGNVNVSLSTVLTGPSSSLVASSSGNVTSSIVNGTTWVISGDPTGSNNGKSWIFQSASVGQWLPLASFDTAAGDARYLMLTPQSPLSGNLDLNGFSIDHASSVTSTTFIGSLSGNASSATSASYIQSSNVWGPYNANSILTASYSLTASYALNINDINTGSLLTTSSFNEYTSSVITTSSFNLYTSSVVNTSSFNIFTGSVILTSSFNVYTGSIVTTSSFNSYTGSSSSRFAGTASYVSGSVFTNNNLALSSSYAITASYALSAGSGVGFPFSGSAVITGSLVVSQSGISITGSLNVSSSISAYNINVGTPSSNAWGQNLNGSYFNTFDSTTTTSEILRFVAGLLSASAPSPLPNTKLFASISIQERNNTSASGGSLIRGYLPNGHSTATSPSLAYLSNQGFISPGNYAFASVGNVFTQSYSASWSSVAGGTNSVSSSADAQLFGLGFVQTTALPYTFYVSGAIFNRFEDNSTGGSSLIQTSSQYLFTQTSFGTSNGLTVGLINTSNPTVIPPRFQDGKFYSPSPFTASLYNGANRAYNNVSSSGYYQITASVLIASGSSPVYSSAVTSSKRIFWAPTNFIDTNVGTNSITLSNVTITSGSAASSSLSGAPYLTSMLYTYSMTASGVFNPMYTASATLVQVLPTNPTTPNGTSITLTTANTTALDTISTIAGTIRTANVVYSSTNTLRSVGNVPSYDDTVRLNPTYTLLGSGYTMAENTPAATTFTITPSALDRKGNAASGLNASTVTMFPAGNFGQSAASGSMQFFGGYNANNTDTLTEYFATESYRKQISVAAAPGAITWNRNKRLILGNGGELQVKPGFLVDPEDSQKGYWYPTSAYNANNYKWYLREFDTGVSANKSNLIITLSGTGASNWVNFDSLANGGIAVGVLFDYQIANKGGGNVVIFDAIKGNASYGGSLNNQSANSSTNPFSDTVDIVGDFSSKSVSSTQITLGLAGAINQTINQSKSKIWILIRYRGSATNSLTGITISTS